MTYTVSKTKRVDCNHQPFLNEAQQKINDLFEKIPASKISSIVFIVNYEEEEKIPEWVWPKGLHSSFLRHVPGKKETEEQ